MSAILCVILRINSFYVILLIKLMARVTWCLIPYVLHLQIYNEKKSQFEIKRNNPKDLVERVAREISKLLQSKRKALEVRGWCCTYFPPLQSQVPSHTNTVHALCFIVKYVKQTDRKTSVLWFEPLIWCTFLSSVFFFDWPWSNFLLYFAVLLISPL